MRRWGAVALLVCLAPSAHGRDLDASYLRGSQVYAPAPEYRVEPPYGPADPAPAFVGAAPASPLTAELGVRYWYSSSRFAKDLYDDPRFSPNLNSRLTYSGQKSHSGEAFGSLEHLNGALIRGFAGGGSIGGGSLLDEDFPPGISPYSSTTSAQRGGALGYAAIDFGYNVVATPTYKLGAFFGYQYLNEEAHAFGCTQTATSPICATPVPGDVRVITEAGYWHAMRVGVAGEVTLFDRLRLAANAAWLPLTTLKTFDTHWLRTGTAFGDFSGPIPQAVFGNGFALEAFASYRFTDCFSLGVGGRYWKLEGRGHADLEQTIVGLPPELAVSQPLTFKTERYGAYLQAAYRFGGR